MTLVVERRVPETRRMRPDAGQVDLLMDLLLAYPNVPGRQKLMEARGGALSARFRAVRYSAGKLIETTSIPIRDEDLPVLDSFLDRHPQPGRAVKPGDLTHKVSFTMSKRLRDRLDEEYARRGYPDRGALIRDALESFLKRKGAPR